MLSDIKKTIFNRKIIKYIISNPKKAFRNMQTYLTTEALYGDMRPIVRGYKEIKTVTLDDFLKKYGKSVDKKDVHINIGEYDLTCTIRPYETQAICTLVKGTNAKRVFEIGTYKGLTTMNMAYNMDKDGKIFSLCLPQEECNFDVGEYVKKDEKAKKKIKLLSGDSTKFDYSPYYDSVDLMFIDGSHYYDYTISDTKNALKCVKNNGFILWHDFNNTHLDNVKAIYEMCKKHNLDLHRIDGTSFAIAQIKK